MVGETPFRHDGAAARDDAGQPASGERNPGQTDARVQREIVDSLFSLLDERIAHQLPGEFFGAAAYFFKCLVDGNGPDGHRARYAGSTRASHECAFPWKDP